MSKIHNINQIVSYIIIKLAAAGFLFFFFFLFAFFGSDMKMFQTVEGISNKVLWAFVFGYGILASIFIDRLIRRYTVTHIKKKIGLYAIAGFGIFLILGFIVNIISADFFNLEFLVYAILAGVVGAFCALIFFLGTVISNYSKIFKYIFAFLIPIGLFILMSRDYTIKKNWESIQNENSYAASFSYFNGQYEIPIDVKKGQIVKITQQFHSENGGGHGFYIKDENNRYVATQLIDDDQSKFKVKKTGIYRAVVTGDEVSGSFYVSWEIAQKKAD
ncbi:hypothetical protein ACIQ4I_03915 [Rummeliibacillus sp. NPDC094406]|uniref:hypothetical protein n=1 Tax=Rummeliibacillus sp. NPDC094406 TaxID=3364511 RepID=UPI00382A4858